VVVGVYGEVDDEFASGIVDYPAAVVKAGSLNTDPGTISTAHFNRILIVLVILYSRSERRDYACPLDKIKEFLERLFKRTN
jgi:hypothetical protein